MNKISKKISVCCVLLTALFSVSQVEADVVYQINLSNLTSGGQYGNWGTVTLSQLTNAVKITVDTGAFESSRFAFNNANVLPDVGTISNVNWPTVTTGYTFQAAPPTAQFDGVGTYENDLASNPPTGSKWRNSPLSFTVSFSGLTIASFLEANTCDTGGCGNLAGAKSFFAVDLRDTTTNNTFFAAVAGTSPGTNPNPVVPIPAAAFFVGPALAFLGFGLNKKRGAVELNAMAA